MQKKKKNPTHFSSPQCNYRHHFGVLPHARGEFMNVCIVLSICFLAANDMPDYKKKYPSNRRKCEETAIMSHLPCRKVTIWVILYTLTISIIICSTAHVFPSLYSMEFLFLSSYMFLFRCSGLKRITSFSSFSSSSKSHSEELHLWSVNSFPQHV